MRSQCEAKTWQIEETLWLSRRVAKILVSKNFLWDRHCRVVSVESVESRTSKTCIPIQHTCIHKKRFYILIIKILRSWRCGVYRQQRVSLAPLAPPQLRRRSPVTFKRRVRCQDPETSFTKQEDRVGTHGLEQGWICNLWRDRLEARLRKKRASW